MMKIKIGIIIILSLIMIGCKDKKEEDVDYYPKTVYVDDRGNKVTMLNDSILIVCTCLEYPEKYKMEVINIKNKWMVINNKQLYKITLTREQLMLISQCVEDISRFAAGDMDLQHTTDTLIDDMDRTESLGIRSFIVNNSRAIRRRLFPDLEDFEHIGYDGGSKDKINRKRLIGNTYQIYRSILHQLAIDENWNNVYSDITLPSGDMGTIKVERVDDDKDNDI